MSQCPRCGEVELIESKGQVVCSTCQLIIMEKVPSRTRNSEPVGGPDASPKLWSKGEGICTL